MSQIVEIALSFDIELSGRDPLLYAEEGDVVVARQALATFGIKEFHQFIWLHVNLDNNFLAMLDSEGLSPYTLHRGIIGEEAHRFNISAATLAAREPLFIVSRARDKTDMHQPFFGAVRPRVIAGQGWAVYTPIVQDSANLFYDKHLQVMHP